MMAAGKGKSHRYSMARYLPLLYMALPGIIFVLLFSYGPIWGWSLAFIDYYPGVPIMDSKFVGLKHFIRLFSGGTEFLMALRNTVMLNLLGLLTSPIPMILAIMLWEVKRVRVRRIFQTMMTLPNFVSWVIVYSLFFALFSVNEGAINQLLVKAGIIDTGINLLGNPRISWRLMISLGVWKGAGWSAIIYLAAIAGIDEELFQAAMVDGASRFRQIWHITVPGIMPTFVVLFVLGIGNMLRAGFETYFVFHNPMVHSKLEVLDTYTYRIGLIGMNFSFATAVGIFNTLVSIGLLLIANKMKKNITGQGIL